MKVFDLFKKETENSPASNKKFATPFLDSKEEEWEIIEEASKRIASILLEIYPSKPFKAKITKQYYVKYKNNNFIIELNKMRYKHRLYNSRQCFLNFDKEGFMIFCDSYFCKRYKLSPKFISYDDILLIKKQVILIKEALEEEFHDSNN